LSKSDTRLEQDAADPSDASDGDDLVLAWRAGDEEAFCEIVRQYGPPIMGFLRRMLGDPSRAEDAWSETFLRLARARDKYVAEGHFRAYLYSIARRCALDQQRSYRRFGQLLNRVVEWKVPSQRNAPPMVSLLAEERSSHVHDALMKLPEGHRTAILLSYQSELPSEEVGRIMGLTAQQVRNRLAYARRLLGDMLEDPWED
jgi:RNA polymerase sigma-70 factor, ECF subfamily